MQLAGRSKHCVPESTWASARPHWNLTTLHATTTATTSWFKRRWTLSPQSRTRNETPVLLRLKLVSNPAQILVARKLR